jgi:hypothetical protein
VGGRYESVTEVWMKSWLKSNHMTPECPWRSQGLGEGAQQEEWCFEHPWAQVWLPAGLAVLRQQQAPVSPRGSRQ